MADMLVTNLLTAIDTRRASDFAIYLADDVYFRFGNAPAIHGRAAVEAAVAGFFEQLESIRHRLLRSFALGDVVIAELEVTYVDQWGRTLVVPCCNVMTRQGDRFSDYRIFIDNSALFVPPAEAAAAAA